MVRIGLCRFREGHLTPLKGIPVPSGQGGCQVASLSFSNVYYTLRKQLNPQAARALVAQLEKLVTVVAVDGTTVQQAITGPFPDFEDGLQYYAAISQPAISAILTRNGKDFRASMLPVLSPAQALLEIEAPA